MSKVRVFRLSNRQTSRTAYSFLGEAFSQATGSTLGTGVFTTDGTCFFFSFCILLPVSFCARAFVEVSVLSNTHLIGPPTSSSTGRFHRSVVRPLFLRNRHPTHLELCDRHAKHAMAHLDSITDAGHSLDPLVC